MLINIDFIKYIVLIYWFMIILLCLFIVINRGFDKLNL